MNRAQSEVVGTVLLLGLIVVGVGFVGYVVIGTIGPDAAPTVDIDASVTNESVTVVHQGGESLRGDDLTVVLRYDDSESRYDFDTAGTYGDDDVFDAGEQWRLDEPVPYGSNARVTVLLIHESSQTLLFRGRKVAATPTPTATPAPKVGGDDAGSAIRLRVDDLTNRDTNRPYYVVSYDVEPTNDSFERVEVEFGSEARYGIVTETDTEERGSATYTDDHGANAEHTVTVRTLYADGEGGTVVGRTRTVTDTADTHNPVAEDLSEAGSPSIDASTAIADESNPDTDELRYRFDYAVETNGNFQRVLLGAINRNGDGGTVRESRPQSSGDVELSDDYGTDTEYKLVILVFDADGVVVDVRQLTDVADGDGP